MTDDASAHVAAVQRTMAELDESRRKSLALIEEVRAERRRNAEEAEQRLAQLRREFEEQEAQRAARNARMQQKVDDDRRQQDKAKKVFRSRNPEGAAKRMHKGMVEVRLRAGVSALRVSDLVDECRAELSDGEWDWLEARHWPKGGQRDKTIIAFYFRDPSKAVKFKLCHGGNC